MSVSLVLCQNPLVKDANYDDCLYSNIYSLARVKRYFTPHSNPSLIYTFAVIFHVLVTGQCLHLLMYPKTKAFPNFLGFAISDWNVGNAGCPLNAKHIVP